MRPRRLSAALAGSALLAALALAAWSGLAGADKARAPIVSASGATAEPAHVSRLWQERYGLLLWRGGLRVSSSDPRFGGFSGLLTDGRGEAFVAVSDRGWWWRGRLAHDARGRLSGLAEAGEMGPMLSSRGRPLRWPWQDAEAIAPWDGRRLEGPVLVAFERKERLALYDWAAAGPRAAARYLRIPAGLHAGRNNGEMEAAARFWAGPLKGWLIAAGEKNFDARGNVRAWAWRGRKTIPFTIVRRGTFRITDMAVLPSGEGFITLERRFSKRFSALPAFALRLFRTRDIAAGRALRGTLLMEASWPTHAIDNMEGLSLYRAGPELRLMLISDDNYNPALQSTLIFQFALPRDVLSRLLATPKP